MSKLRPLSYPQDTTRPWQPPWTKHLTCQPPQGSAQEVYGAKLPAGQWDSGKATLALQPRSHYPAPYPNGSLRPEAQALQERGWGWGLGRTDMGPSAAVTHPVISWTFIHFPLNYVLLKMVLFGFSMARACSRLLCVPGNC